MTSVTIPIAVSRDAPRCDAHSERGVDHVSFSRVCCSDGVVSEIGNAQYVDRSENILCAHDPLSMNGEGGQRSIKFDFKLISILK